MALSSGEPTFTERLQKSLGYYRFLYYKYVDYFKKNPLDIDDLVDGLIYIHLMSQRDKS